MKSLLLLYLLSSLSLAYAGPVEDACGGSELRLDAPGKSMENLPVLDQSTGSSAESGGLCYSYVASQMLDAHLQKNGNRPQGRVSSPFHMAMNHAVARNRSRLGGGEPCLAIAATAESGGTCDHDRWFFGSRDPSNRHYLYTLESIWDSSQSMRDLEPILNEEYRARSRSQDTLARRAHSEACRLATVDPFSSSDRGLYQSSHQALLALLADNNYFSSSDEAGRTRDKFLFMRDFANMVCEPSENPIQPVASCTPFNYGPNQTQQFQLDLLSRLSSSELPVGVGFCSYYLQDPQRPRNGHNHRVLNWEQEEGNDVPKCNRPYRDAGGALAIRRTNSHHISMVMGKRMRNGRCQVLLRNTWGADACEIYQTAGHTDCQRGQVWLDLEELAKNSFAQRAMQ